MSANRCIALVAMTLGLLTGCASYQPGVDSKPEMSVEEARTVVRESRIYTAAGGGVASKIELTRIGLRHVYENGRSEMCRFDQITRVERKLEAVIFLHGCQLSFDILGENNSRRFVDAVYVLKQDYLPRTAPETPQQQAAFDAVVRQYRETQPPPALPESAARFKVQAEFAVQQKRFEDAAELYAKALEVSPWWPQGRYNRGLILGELEAYPEAIRELQKYLKLEPGAPNARAVQEQIYRWESVATKGVAR